MLHGQFAVSRLGDPWDPPFMDGSLLFFQVVATFTYIVFAVIFVATCYTYGAVVGVLAMVEAPTSDTLQNETRPAGLHEENHHDETDDPCQPLLPRSDPVDPEAVTGEPSLTTSSMPGTIRQLRARTGWFSRFRGLALFLATVFVAFWLWMLIRVAVFDPSFYRTNTIADILSGVLTSMCLGGCMLAWTHQVISTQHAVRWYRRIGNTKFRTVAKLMPATALWGLAAQLTTGLPISVYNTFYYEWYGSAPWWNHGLSVIIVYGLAIILVFLLLLPATVILVRVQASLLPEDVETIVALDRSFGGKVHPAGDGDGAALGIFDAWESVDGVTRRRLLLHYIKVLMMLSALVVICGALYALELLILT